MDYLCVKFGDCIFSHFGFIVRTDRHTQTESHTHSHTNANNRLTHATTVGVKKILAWMYLITKKSKTWIFVTV